MEHVEYVDTSESLPLKSVAKHMLGTLIFMISNTHIVMAHYMIPGGMYSLALLSSVCIAAINFLTVTAADIKSPGIE